MTRGEFELKKRGISRKGQFTVFVILGIVLLIMVGLSLFFVSLIADLNYKEQAKKAVEDYMSSAAINYYVYTCVDSAVKTSLIEMGYQGGRLFTEQEGVFKKNETPGINYVPFNYTFESSSSNIQENFSVPYAIMDEGLCTSVSFNAPMYPFDKTRLDKLEQKYQADDVCRFDLEYKNSGVFGFNTLSRLCYLTGDNFKTTFTALENIRSVCAKNVVINESDSIEKELAKRITNRTRECVNFSIFEADKHNITLLGQPNASIVYSEEYFSVFIEFPFKVKLENKEPVVVNKEYEYVSKLRFVTLHNYLLNLIKKETQDPFFNITKDYMLVQDYDPAFRVYLFSAESAEECVDCAWKHDYVLMVQDTQSKIGEQPLSIFSAIKNRKPALDYIHEEPIGSAFDVVVMENQTILFKPQGIDPESNSVLYFYEGWKETYDEYYDFADGACSNPLNFVTIEGCVKEHNPPKPPPREWSKSDEYNITKKDASYRVRKNDTGPHDVIIKVMDEAGLVDYQIVRVLVIDKPEFNVSFRSYYPEFLENISLEDPFYLDSSQRVFPAVAPAKLNASFWEIFKIRSMPAGDIYDSVVEVTVDFNPDSTSADPLPVPFDEVLIPNETYSINNISVVPVNETGTHDISLTLDFLLDVGTSTVSLARTNFKEVNVRACIPLYKERAGLNDPFPYHEGVDPFEDTNHICCTNSFEFASDATPCHDEVWYGEFNDLKNQAGISMKNVDLAQYYVATGKTAPLPTPKAASVATTNSVTNNDIFKLEFERFCDGQRGNICSGKGEYILSSVSPCATLGPGETERCSGPPLTPVKDVQPACRASPLGSSFEKETLGLGIADPKLRDGICNENPKCSNLVAGIYDPAAGGPQRCTATCNGVGSCNAVTNSLCSCDLTCGATCDETTDFNGVGNVCHYGCNLNTDCEYAFQKTLPCPIGTNCFFDGATLSRPPGCYINTYCDASGGDATLKETCATRGTVLNIGTLEYCVYGAVVHPSPCDNAGNCNYAKVRKPINPAPCPVAGEVLVCNAISGWECGVPI